MGMVLFSGAPEGTLQRGGQWEGVEVNTTAPWTPASRKEFILCAAGFWGVPAEKQPEGIESSQEQGTCGHEHSTWLPV